MDNTISRRSTPPNPHDFWAKKIRKHNDGLWSWSLRRHGNQGGSGPRPVTSCRWRHMQLVARASPAPSHGDLARSLALHPVTLTREENTVGQGLPKQLPPPGRGSHSTPTQHQQSRPHWPSKSDTRVAWWVSGVRDGHLSLREDKSWSRSSASCDRGLMAAVYSWGGGSTIDQPSPHKVLQILLLVKPTSQWGLVYL